MAPAEGSGRAAGVLLRLALPLAFAAYPILSFYQANVDQVTAGEIASALGESLAAAAVLTALAFLAFRSAERAALASSALLAAFFSYGMLYDVIAHRLPRISGDVLGIGLSENRVLAAGLALALLALFAALTREGFPARQVTRIATILGVTLLASSVVMTGMALVSVSKAEAPSHPTAETSATAVPVADGSTAVSGAEMPDIYYIVLDRYMGLQAMRDVAGYDNEPFLDDLRASGFYVAENAYANYAVTYLSLGATLNMRYLDAETQLPQFRTREAGMKLDRRPFYDLIADNRVARFLQSRGYSYVHLTSGWAATDSSPIADRVIDTKKDSEFCDVFLQTTGLRPFVETSAAAGKRERITRTFEMLDGVRAARQPVFAFAHVMVPHPGYVFDANGGVPNWDTEKLRSDKAAELEAYIEQLRYTNKLVLAQIGKLTEERGRPVVVIIQGDHGGNYRRPGWENTDLHRGKLSILSAVYYSDGDPGTLYDSVSPVNTFRILFDSRFGTDLGPLPDRSYYTSTETWPYWPSDVTEEIRATGRP